MPYKCVFCPNPAAEDSDYCGQPGCPGNEPALGDFIPSITSPEAIRKIAALKAKYSGLGSARLAKMLAYCREYLAENTKDGRVYLMIDANQVHGFALKAEAIMQILEPSNA